MAKLLIYAAVPDTRMLAQGFYAAEAEGLLGHPEVTAVQLTNRLSEVARADYDGLISFFYSHSAAAALIARLRGRPVVVTGGGEQIFPELAGSRPRYIARIGANLASQIGCLSRVMSTKTRSSRCSGRAVTMFSFRSMKASGSALWKR